MGQKAKGLVLSFFFLIIASGCGGGGSSGLATVVSTPTEGHEIIAEGSSIVENSDTALARKNAINGALHSAVEQVLGTLISAESLTCNFALIEESILNKSDGYAKIKEVLEEKQESDLYKVKLIAIVYDSALKNDIDALMTSQHYPKIMIIIQETDLGQKSSLPASEAEMIKKFVEEGFKVLDQNAVNVIRDNQGDTVNAAVNGDVDSAISLAKLGGADVIITGLASSEENPSGNLGGLFSAQAHVEGRAIDIQTGEIVAANVKTTDAIDTTLAAASKKALQNTADLLAEDMIEPILSIWYPKTTIHIQLNGDLKFNKYSELKDVIAKLEGFQEMDEREFDADTGVAELAIRVQCATEKIIANALNGVKTESGYSISATVQTITIKSQEKDIAVLVTLN